MDIAVHGTTVTVADRGPGLDPESLPGLLVRYRSPGGGTGIGLSLVRDVAAAHGGDITVRRRPGGGSVFALMLGPAQRRTGRPRTRRRSADRDPSS